MISSVAWCCLVTVTLLLYIKFFCGIHCLVKHLICLSLQCTVLRDSTHGNGRTSVVIREAIDLTRNNRIDMESLKSLHQVKSKDLHKNRKLRLGLHYILPICMHTKEVLHVYVNIILKGILILRSFFTFFIILDIRKFYKSLFISLHVHNVAGSLNISTVVLSTRKYWSVSLSKEISGVRV